MPITMQHEPGPAISGLAAVMSGAGAADQGQFDRSASIAQTAMGIGARRDMQAQQLQAQRAAQERQIQARAELQKQAAREAEARTAQQAGLQEQYKEQQFAQEIAKMREAAKIEAQQFEHKYTAKQRTEIARRNQAIQQLKDSDTFSPEQKQAMLPQLEAWAAGIDPELVPKDPANQRMDALAKEGKGIGDIWVDQNGAVVRRNEKGIPDLLLRPDQTEQYMQREMEMKQQADLQKSMLDFRMELAKEEITVTDKYGVDTGEKRRRGPDEINEIMQNVFGGEAGQAGGMQQTGTWLDTAEEKGLRVEQADMDLPDEVAYAQALVRTYRGTHGGPSGMPLEKRREYFKAQEILRAYLQQQQQASQQRQDPTTPPIQGLNTGAF